MLGSFLSSYPTGSILTELVQIYNGKYIVKASLQIDGVTRATAMAAADTLEIAEDSARTRAITFFGTGATITQQPITTSVTTSVTEAPPLQPKIVEQSSLDNSLHNGATRVTSEPPAIPVSIAVETPTQPVSETVPINNLETNVANNTNTASLEIPSVEEVAPVKSKTKAETKTKTTQEISQFTEANTNNIPSFTKVTETTFNEPAREPLFDTYEELAPAKPKFEPSDDYVPSVSIAAPSEFDVAEEKPTTIPSNVTPFTGRNYNPPEEIELPPVNIVPSSTSTTTSKRKKKTEPTDQSDDIAKIGVEMQRLGWTTEQGRDYLVKQYGKRSRHLLSPEELRDFRQFLESQPTPEDPLAFDPIAGF